MTFIRGSQNEGMKKKKQEVEQGKHVLINRAKKGKRHVMTNNDSSFFPLQERLHLPVFAPRGSILVPLPLLPSHHNSLLLSLLIYLFVLPSFLPCRHPKPSSLRFRFQSFTLRCLTSLHPSTSPPFNLCASRSHLEALQPQLELKPFWSTSSCRVVNKGGRQQQQLAENRSDVWGLCDCVKNIILMLRSHKLCMFFFILTLLLLHQYL